ncbi:RNA polymerase sigma factor [Rhodococcus ruber Chol-4]|uniref:sigma-70 family RNA polymerase sigma factor n=1 Tax=Rhodococcus ruber TaxID=1830 RepID=UPI000347EEA5|nr:sigma-70 family RNA polymerase sigma factor [Rhodococcus ruber]KXF88055.1 RNA polymerase sigma factor [Rhodococcus ruber Chol-4]
MSDGNFSAHPGGAFPAEQFEAHRDRLRAVAFRMLGSASEADDAVQEAWLRLHRPGTDEVANLGDWLTTVVSRVCLDMLRSRGSRREVPLDQPDRPEPRSTDPRDVPESAALLADSVGVALLVVLDTLAPAERLAFVLHDLFAVPFDEIAPIVERSPAATRQLASRARRRIQGATAPRADLMRRRRLVDAFLAASREGRFDDLLALLDPGVILRADDIAVATARAGAAHGTPALARELHGPHSVAEVFDGRAQAARAVLVDGMPGAAWAPGGRPRTVFAFTIEDDAIVEIEVVSDPEQLAALEVTFPDAG